MENFRCLVVSYSLPIRATGTPVVIRNFLENFKSDEIVLIGRPVKMNEKISNYHVNYPIYVIPTPPVGTRMEKFWRLLSLICGLFLGIYAIKKHKITNILTFYRDYSSLMTGYLLHKITKIPFSSYFCDLYSENYPIGFYSNLAKWLQPRIFRCSFKVFVLTEAMQEYYKETYNLQTTVLPHCVNNFPKQKIILDDYKSPFRIGYLGDINIDRIFSIKLLCEAILNNEDYELIYFTPKSDEFLIKENLLIPNSKRIYISNNEILLRELNSCDVLFLPVMQSQDHFERNPQVMTGFPTKTIEYLFASKPILIHGKKEYFISKFSERYKFSLIVEGGVKELFSALETLKNDYMLRENLAYNTYKALKYFDGVRISNLFRKEISKN